MTRSWPSGCGTVQPRHVREHERFEQPQLTLVYEQQQLGFNYRLTDIQETLKPAAVR